MFVLHRTKFAHSTLLPTARWRFSYFLVACLLFLSYVGFVCSTAQNYKWDCDILHLVRCVESSLWVCDSKCTIDSLRFGKTHPCLFVVLHANIIEMWSWKKQIYYLVPTTHFGWELFHSLFLLPIIHRDFLSDVCKNLK